MMADFSRSLVVVAGLLFLGACETVDKQAEFRMTAQQAPAGIVPTKLMLQGSESNVVLSNEGQLRQVLESFGGNTAPQNLKSLIQQIRNSNDLPGVDVPGLTGLGGGFGHTFLDLADEAVLGNGHFNQGARVVVSVSGQILDYEFDRTQGTDAGNGMLEVVTYITSRVVPAGQGVPPPRTDAYKWIVRVINDSLEVRERGPDPNDPFPGTIPFDAEMVQRVNSLGFTHKLWAKGADIVVDEVKFKRNYTPGTDWSTINPLNPNSPKNARLYQSSDASCIDMMFASEPPATFADLQAPPFYCLGRCEHPWIINTR